MFKIISNSPSNIIYKNHQFKQKFKNFIPKLQTQIKPIKHTTVSAALALVSLMPLMSGCFCNNSSRSKLYMIEEQTNQKNSKQITEGFVGDRDIEEIKQLTGLTEIEYKTALKTLYECEKNITSATGNPKPYILGTEADLGSIFNRDTSFSVVLGDAGGTYTAEYKYNKRKKEFTDQFYIPLKCSPGINKVRIIREKNGDFTCIGNEVKYEGWGIKYINHPILRNYTKDGKLKRGASYIPNTISAKGID